MTALPKSYSHHGYVQLPPNSTGPCMGTVIHLHVNYSNGTRAFSIGEDLIGETSGAIAVIYDVYGTTSSGTIVCTMEDNVNAVDFTVGETLSVDGTAAAVVSSTYQFHTQSVAVVSSDNPHYGQRIGPKGGAYIRYSEGEQQLDAFGLTRMSSPTQMAQYMFQYNTMSHHWHGESDGTGGTMSHLQNESSLAFDVDAAAGSYYYRTTNRYHLYQTGYGTLVEMTITVGDNGKENCRRRWGFFDQTDGLFFELDGTDFKVVERSSTDGTPQEESYFQHEFNGDRVDGVGGAANLSGMNLDLAKINLYWIDTTWLGAGKSRFGVFDEQGTRITLHTINHGNIETAPWSSQANLPVRVEIENTGTTASPSRIKLTGADVKCEGNLVGAREKLAKKYSFDSGPRTLTDSTNWTHIASFRSAKTINGRPNRKVTIPELAAVYVAGGPIVVGLFEDTTAQDGTWHQCQYGGAIEINPDASTWLYQDGSSTGMPMVTWCHEAGTYNLEMPKNFGLFSKNMILRADGEYGAQYSILAKLLSDATAEYRVFPTLLDVV